MAPLRSPGVGEGMRTTWDAAAASDRVEHYVGDPATAKQELDSLFSRLGEDPHGGACVEVGCGFGRMTGLLAQRFDRVVAVDVSPLMLEQARARVPDANVTFLPVSGTTLEPVESASADVVVCYLVLQHLPARDVVTAYLREFGRVLAPDGRAFVQLPVLGPGFRARLWRAGRGFAVPMRQRGRGGEPAGVPRLPPHRLGARPRARGRRPARGGARREPRLSVSVRPRSVLAARADVVATALALAVFAVAIGAAAVAVWRRPLVALYLFVVGLAAHNLVMALLWGAGVRGASLELISAWKEILLAVAFASVALPAVRARRLPFRPGAIDALALAFAVLVLVYAVIPQSALDGNAGHSAVLHAIRHDLVPVVAFFLGRAVGVTGAQIRSVAWTILGTGAAVAGFGLIEEYTVSVGWWHRSGAVGYFRHQLGFDYHGPGGMPENFAFNTGNNHLFRRLISTFISPLAAAYMLVVSLLVAPLRRLALPLAALVFAGLVFTISRSALTGLVAGLVVLAIARRRLWPLAAAVVVIGVGIGFDRAYTHVAPTTHFLPAELKEQEQNAHQHPGAKNQLFNFNEPSWRSHLSSLRHGLGTVVHHPQGYGLGNAGATAERFGVELKAGESNYTEIGVETGLVGMILFVALEPGAARGARPPRVVGATRRPPRRRRRGRRGARRCSPDRRADRRVRHPLARLLPLVALRLADRRVLALGEQRQALKAADDDGLADLGAGLAARVPDLPADRRLSARAAALDHPRLDSDQRFGADLRAPSLRPPDTDAGLRDLEDRRAADCDHSPGRGKDEDREHDRQDDGQDWCRRRMRYT